MTCLIKGCNFVLRNIPHEVFAYQKDSDTEFRFQTNHPNIFPYLLVNIGSGVSIVKVSGGQNAFFVGDLIKVIWNLSLVQICTCFILSNARFKKKVMPFKKFISINCRVMNAFPFTDFYFFKLYLIWCLEKWLHYLMRTKAVRSKWFLMFVWSHCWRDQV